MKSLPASALDEVWLCVTGNELTLREYFKELLCTLWDKAELFSGKRPFGNSGWQYDVYKALIEADLLEGGLDEDGYVKTMNTKEADRLIIELIVEHL